jgi:hypothetical protein
MWTLMAFYIGMVILVWVVVTLSVKNRPTGMTQNDRDVLKFVTGIGIRAKPGEAVSILEKLPLPRIQ